MADLMSGTMLANNMALFEEALGKGTGAGDQESGAWEPERKAEGRRGRVIDD